MNFVLGGCILYAIFLGFIHGQKEINDVRTGKKPGVKESKNLFTFLFCDKY